MHTTETHYEEQHPAGRPGAAHSGGSGRAPPRGHVSTSSPAPHPRSRVHQDPPRTRPGSGSRSPNLCGFCRPAAETTGDPELWRPVSAWLTAAGPGVGAQVARARAGVAGGRPTWGGGAASGPRVRARPAGTPLPTHLIPTQVPAIVRLAGAGRPRTGRRCGVPARRPQRPGQATSGVGGRFCPEQPHRGWGLFGTGSARQEHQGPRG